MFSIKLGITVFVLMAICDYSTCTTRSCYQCTGNKCETGSCEGERCFKLYSQYERDRSKYVEAQYGCTWTDDLIDSSLMDKKYRTYSDFCVAIKDRKWSVPSFLKIFMNKYYKKTELCVCKGDYCNSSATVKSFLILVTALMVFAFML